MKSGFSTDFTMVRSPNRVLTPLKSASFEIRISSFVHRPKSSFWRDKSSHTGLGNGDFGRLNKRFVVSL